MDSIQHQHEKAGNQDMPCLNYRREYADLPLEHMINTLTSTFGDLFNDQCESHSFA